MIYFKRKNIHADTEHVSVKTCMDGQSYPFLSCEVRATKEILSVKPKHLKKMGPPGFAGYVICLLLGNLSKFCNIFF